MTALTFVKQSSLPAAIGATTYSDPTVKNAVKRVRIGQLSEPEFRKMYSGNIRHGFLIGKSRHASKGITGRTADDFATTLAR